MLVTRDGRRLLAERSSMKSDLTFWILARTSGLVAYALLTASLVPAGLVLKSRPFSALKPALVTDLHRFLARSRTRRPLAARAHARPRSHRADVDRRPARPRDRALLAARTGLGVLAAELMVVVYASFSLRTRIGIRNWRRLHWATYLALAFATLHGLAAGTDSGTTWALAPTAAPPAPSSPPPPGAHSSHPRKDARVSHRDRSLVRSGFDLRLPAQHPIGADGLADVAVGETDETAVLDAAAARPMGAITVYEQSVDQAA